MIRTWRTWSLLLPHGKLMQGKENQPGSINVIQNRQFKSEAKEKLQLVHGWNRMNGKLTFFKHQFYTRHLHTYINPHKSWEE